MNNNKPEVVVDTNVAVVANGLNDRASAKCIRRCIKELQHIQRDRRVLLDDKHLILREYHRNLHISGQPRLGDAFYKWLHENQANRAHCRMVPVNPNASRGFEEFPEDPNVGSFDRDDRKFVAVALASGTNPPIINASDTDWWEYRQELRCHGVEVVFLCPELMKLRR